MQFYRILTKTHFIMIDIEEIKHRINKGKRKWSSSLIDFIQPKLNDGYTYEYISNWLKIEHNIEISPTKLMYYKFHNKKASGENKREVSQPSARKEERAIPNERDFLKEINEKSEILSKERKAVENNDFKNKFLKDKTKQV